jgi:hypothetical protein
MLRRVALVRADVSEELSASFIKVTRIGEVGTTLAVTSKQLTMRWNTTDSCHPDEGGANFLRNVSSYKSHTTQHLRRHHSLYVACSVSGRHISLTTLPPQHYRPPRPVRAIALLYIQEQKRFFWSHGIRLAFNPIRTFLLLSCTSLNEAPEDTILHSHRRENLKSYEALLVYNFSYCSHRLGARGSIVIKALCYKPESRGFETRWCEWFLSIYLILPAALGPGVYSVSNRNEYQKHKNNVSVE